MKRIMKNTCSILLAAILSLSFLLPALAAGHCDNDPVIYIHGYNALRVTDPDGTVRHPIDGEGDSDNTLNMVRALAPDLLRAIATNDYDAYCDKAYDMVSEIYKDISPNPDGTQKPNTGIDWSWSPATVSAAHGPKTQYHYLFDIRRDPLEIADDLNAYIETVKAKTGHDQVTLASRCIGTNVALAYLYKYQRPSGYDGIKNSIFIYGGLGGFTHLEYILSGSVKLTDDGVYHFAKSGFGNLVDFEGFGGGELSAILFETLDMLRTTHGLHLTAELVNKIYEKVKDKFIARVLKDYYGTSLTHISALTEKYEDYKKYIFQEPGDLQKYAALIEKADYYHYNVLAQKETILKEMDGAGKYVYFIDNYGDQAAPLSEEANGIGDAYATLRRQTLGATGSTVAGTLSDAYIRQQQEKGLGKYISPDRQADLSTCLFPDQTWVVKNMRHDTQLLALDNMIAALAHSEHATADTLEGYPRFMAKDPNDYAPSFLPAQEKNATDIDWAAIDRDAAAGTVSFLKRAIDFITDLIKKLIYYVSGQWITDQLGLNQ